MLQLLLDLTYCENPPCWLLSLPAPKAAFLAFLLVDPSHLSVEAAADRSARPAASAAASAAAAPSAPLGKDTRDETVSRQPFNKASVSLVISVI